MEATGDPDKAALERRQSGSLVRVGAGEEVGRLSHSLSSDAIFPPSYASSCLTPPLALRNPSSLTVNGKNRAPGQHPQLPSTKPVPSLAITRSLLRLSCLRRQVSPPARVLPPPVIDLTGAGRGDGSSLGKLPLKSAIKMRLEK